ncbi:MAG: hypothetical protein U0002_15095 [Thermoanaerobaculia bacterium]
MPYRRLDSAKIIETVVRLRARIAERFPDSGLSRVCAEIEQVARETEARSAWIAEPKWWLRVLVGLVAAIALLGLAGALRSVQVRWEALDIGNLIQSAEAMTNELVLLVLAVLFLGRIEGRVKRRKALAALHELRALAHVVDMHQLTKDPETTANPQLQTASSPSRSLSRFELARYLDYASEMLAILGKVAALYAQHFDDEVVLDTVNEIESLTSNLSRKIWQKLTILETQRER